MTSAIDIKRYGTRAMTWDGASNCSRQVILEVLSFCYQFPRPARKNSHPVSSSRFLSRVFVITISSHLNRENLKILKFLAIKQKSEVVTHIVLLTKA